MPKLLIFLVLGLLKAGCSSEEPNRFEYVERVAGVLDQAPIRDKAVLTATPSQRDLRLEIPEHKINPLQFAELHRCDMGDLVGERNSGLGRFAPDSQRLGYEVRWLCRAQACDLDWIDELALQKQDALGKLVWNATIAGPEFAMLINGSSGNVDSAAIAAIGDPIIPDCSHSQEAFEAKLHSIQRSGGVQGRRIQWAAFRDELLSVVKLFERQKRPICLNGEPTLKAQRLIAVFRRYYIERLQPKMSEAMQRDREWVNAFNVVHQSLSSIAPDAWLEFYKQTLDRNSETSEWQRTQRAIIAHSRAWQNVFDQCGIDIRSIARLENPV